MALPLIVLAALSVVGGYFLYSGDLFKKWLYPNGLSVVTPEMVPKYPSWETGLLLLSVAAAFAGIAAGYARYKRGLPEDEGWDLAKWKPWRRAALDQFGYDRAFMGLSLKGGAALGAALWKGIDVGLIDGLVNGIGWLTGQFGQLLRKLQTGYVRGYALLTLLGVLAILGYLAWALRQGGGF